MYQNSSHSVLEMPQPDWTERQEHENIRFVCVRVYFSTFINIPTGPRPGSFSCCFPWRAVQHSGQECSSGIHLPELSSQLCCLPPGNLVSLLSAQCPGFPHLLTKGRGYDNNSTYHIESQGGINEVILVKHLTCSWRVGNIQVMLVVAVIICFNLFKLLTTL